MKKKYCLIILVASFTFARVSSEHNVVLAPSVVFSAAFHHYGVVLSKDYGDGDTIKWKRRHKRRKKTRRPHRGK